MLVYKILMSESTKNSLEANYILMLLQDLPMPENWGSCFQRKKVLFTLRKVEVIKRSECHHLHQVALKWANLLSLGRRGSLRHALLAPLRKRRNIFSDSMSSNKVGHSYPSSLVSFSPFLINSYRVQLIHISNIRFELFDIIKIEFRKIIYFEITSKMKYSWDIWSRSVFYCDH